jgi:molecular chaperone GrpE
MGKNEENNDDIVFEENTEVTGADSSKKVKKLQTELQKCKEEKAEYLDGWQRSKAEFVNFKKRSAEDTAKFRMYANESLILEILPTIDNFEAALKDHGESEDTKKWKTGFEHIYNQLLRTLESAGAEQLNPVNEDFDPNKHESVEIIPTENTAEDNKISEVVMKGYRLGEKILRAPQVKVWVKEE